MGMLYDTILEAPVWDAKRWPNFKPQELACKCNGRYCQGEYYHDPEFLDRLQAVRNDVGRSLWLTSGHRCDLWNAAVGGAPMSQHKKLAVDISLHGHDRWGLLESCISHGFNGIGKATNFLHIDRRAIPAVWYYGKSAQSWKIG